MPAKDSSEAPSPSSTRSTREVILDVAERLLGERGLAGASLRAITQEAGVNLAAVSYHFGSKQGLILALLERRFGPMNEARLEGLERVLSQNPPGERLSGILRAYVLPVVEAVGPDVSGRHRALVMGRLFAQPKSTELRTALVEAFSPVAEAFVQALCEELAGAEKKEVYWRFHFAVGALLHTAANSVLIEQVSEGHCCANDGEATTERLIEFLTAGFRSLEGSKDKRPSNARDSHQLSTLQAKPGETS